MPLSFKVHKCLWLLLIVAYFTAGYFALSWFNSTRTCYYNPGFSFENKIPFIPVFIFGYLLVYLALAGLYPLIDDRPLFNKTLLSFAILITIHFIFFAMIPVKMDLRPTIKDVSGTIDIFVRFYFWLDKPYNCFPSLHVAFPFLGALVLWGYKRAWSYVYIIATVIIAISVVLVRQHYIADVAGGLITPLFVVYSVKRLYNLY